MMIVEQPSATFRPAALSSGKPSARVGHLPFAADLMAALRPPLLAQLGIGSGDAYFGLCQIVKQYDIPCTCYGIDAGRSDKPDGNGAGHGMAEAAQRHNQAQYRGFSHLLFGKNFGEALQQFEDGSIGVLDMDGHFGYAALKQTYQGWIRKVRPDGVLLLNGIAMRENGSAKLWEEIQVAHPSFSFRHGEGMGVIGKSKEAEKSPFLSELFQASKEQQENARRYYFFCAERLEMAARLEAAGSADMENSLFRVYCSQAGKYETTPEQSQSVGSGAWVNLRLDLPRGVGDQALRMEVANRPAVVEIAALSLRKAGGNALWTWNPKDVTDALRVDGTAARMPASGAFRVLCLGQSPHCYLPEFRGPAYEQPLELEVRLRVDLEMTAVREMNEKWQELEKTKAELEGRKAAGSGINKAAMEAAIANVKANSLAQTAELRAEHEQRIKEITADAEARLQAMRSEYEQQTTQQLLHVEEERRQYQGIVVERDRLSAQHARMLQEIAIAQGNVADLKAEIERLTGDMSNTEADMAELRKLNARLSAALEEERAARMDMQDSSSWQLTKPLRAVGDLFGPRKKF